MQEVTFRIFGGKASIRATAYGAGHTETKNNAMDFAVHHAPCAVYRSIMWMDFLRSPQG
jgi:hypothetical protein